MFLAGALRGGDGLAQNSCQLVRLIDQFRQPAAWQQLGPHNQSQPHARLSQLFQANAELVGKICFALRSASLLVVGDRRGPAANQLTRYVSSQSRFGLAVDNLGNSSCKIQEPVRKLVRVHRSSLMQELPSPLSAICNLHFSICSLQFNSYSAARFSSCMFSPRPRISLVSTSKLAGVPACSVFSPLTIDS